MGLLDQDEIPLILLVSCTISTSGMSMDDVRTLLNVRVVTSHYVSTPVRTLVLPTFPLDSLDPYQGLPVLTFVPDPIIPPSAPQRNNSQTAHSPSQSSTPSRVSKPHPA